LQVDPTDPPPVRDARWVALVLGACCVVVGVILLIVNAVVDAGTSFGGAGCGAPPGASPCASELVEYLFLIPGVALLGIGAVVVAVILVKLS
jgi:hypothetical protein